jgi:hypothetical protein
MSRTANLHFLTLPAVAMCAVVVASNILVQYPFRPFGLQDYFTWGAFSYPVAFLVNDLTNRRFGPAAARRVVIAGFVMAVVLSAWFANPRIAMASGSAFLVAQLLDVTVFDRLRQGLWWLAPLLSSFLGSAVDTAMFFSLAFAPVFSGLGPNVDFAIQGVMPFGGLFGEMPRWLAWALSDFALKLAMGLAMLIPYGALRGLVRPLQTGSAGQATPG